MEQVPIIGIVGNGRVARHLLFYFQSLSIKTVHHADARLAPNSDLLQCSSVWFLISDDVIESVAQSYIDYKCTLVHCSGARYFDHIVGIHPLTCFSDELFDHKTYATIPLICDHTLNGPLLWLHDLLSNPIKQIDKNDKALYHALCVLGGNLSTMLWSEVMDRSQELGISKELFYPYMKQTIDNLISCSDPLTGPIARNDHNTIDGNLEALSGSRFKDVYKSFLPEGYYEN